jgi:hypothetical protein
MKKCQRYITSLLLTMIYLVIVFSPLAPLAMQSKLVAHAVTGECSGDCRIDGCSLERSAAHTCCCAQKKLNARRSSNKGFSYTHPAEAPKKGASCCATTSPDAHDDDGNSAADSDSPPQKKSFASFSSKPCGSGKLFALLSIETTHHLPFFFSGEISSPAQSILTFIPPDHLTSRYVDPPDPPPIITHAS